MPDTHYSDNPKVQEAMAGFVDAVAGTKAENFTPTQKNEFAASLQEKINYFKDSGMSEDDIAKHLDKQKANVQREWLADDLTPTEKANNYVNDIHNNFKNERDNNQAKVYGNLEQDLNESQPKKTINSYSLLKDGGMVLEISQPGKENKNVYLSAQEVAEHASKLPNNNPAHEQGKKDIQAFNDDGIPRALNISGYEINNPNRIIEKGKDDPLKKQCNNYLSGFNKTEAIAGINNLKGTEQPQNAINQLNADELKEIYAPHKVKEFEDRASQINQRNNYPEAQADQKISWEDLAKQNLVDHVSEKSEVGLRNKQADVKLHSMSNEEIRGLSDKQLQEYLPDDKIQALEKEAKSIRENPNSPNKSIKWSDLAKGKLEKKKHDISKLPQNQPKEQAPEEKEAGPLRKLVNKMGEMSKDDDRMRGVSEVGSAAKSGGKKAAIGIGLTVALCVVGAVVAGPVGVAAALAIGAVATAAYVAPDVLKAAKGIYKAADGPREMEKAKQEFKSGLLEALNKGIDAIDDKIIERRNAKGPVEFKISKQKESGKPKDKGMGSIDDIRKNLKGKEGHITLTFEGANSQKEHLVGSSHEIRKMLKTPEMQQKLSSLKGSEMGEAQNGHHSTASTPKVTINQNKGQGQAH